MNPVRRRKDGAPSNLWLWFAFTAALILWVATITVPWFL